LLRTPPQAQHPPLLQPRKPKESSMATVRVPNAGPDLLQFRPRWVFDPVPDWVLEHLSTAVIRELAVVNVQVQLETLAVQQKALEQTMNILKRAK
jgi:hypothetical protein